MFSELFIALLVGSSFGIFVWLVFTRVADRATGYGSSLVEKAGMSLADMFVFVDVRKYIPLYLAAVILLPLLVYGLSGYFSLALASFIALLAAPHVTLKILYQRRLNKIEQQLPDALAMLSGSLKAGSSLTIALDQLVQDSTPPLSQEFSILVRERKLGIDMDMALSHMERRIPLEDFTILISAIRISREVGGNLSETLDVVADTLRKKLAMEGKINSLTAQGKLQGLVMSSLPLLLMVVLLKLEPAAMSMLFHTKLGWAVLALVFVMELLGFLSIRKITQINV